MKQIIVALGGTGQMVLHYYAQLYLLGIVRDSFRALVVDTDTMIDSLACLQRFFANVSEAWVAHGASPSEVAHIQVRSGGDNQVHQVLMGRPLPNVPAPDSPPSAFFSRDALSMPAMAGMYGRPALVSVADCQQYLHSLSSELQLENGAQVVVVSSAIGGTGGGLVVKTIAHIERMMANWQGISLRAVLFGDYFRPNEALIQDARSRFLSNRTFVVTTLKETISSLHRFAIVEPESKPERNPEAEKTGRRLPWPTGRDALWYGVAALRFLLTDATQDRPDRFEDREVPSGTYLPSLNYEASRQRLKDRLAVVDALRERKVLSLMMKEALPESVWRGPLVDFVREYWKLTLRAQGADFRKVAAFGPALAHETVRAWDERSSDYQVVHVFEKAECPKASVSQVRDTPWPTRFRDNIDGTPMQNLDRAAKIAAEGVLFAALRGVS
jgi:hypothetical protein